MIVSPTNVIWFESEANAISNINPLSNSQLLVDGATYYAVATSGSCTSTPFAITVSVTLGVKENFINFIQVYPNPTNDFINIKIESELKSIEIYNIQGQKILTSNQKQVNVSHLASGVYLVQVTNQALETATRRIVIGIK